MALVFIFIRWTVNRVAKDVLKRGCGKCILCSSCRGSGGQFLDSAVKPPRIVFERYFQELFYGKEKDPGKAPRSLWFLLFKASLAHMDTLTCFLKEWSQDCLPKTA